jgi:hypothetical protein
VTRPDNFILRWARMKRGLDTAPEPGVAETGLPSASAETGADAAAVEPFDLASLPSIESIVADTDIGVFLRPGVPAELTRAALRCAWASDPAIRDFIGIAENQWNFNDPDAIPGFGPLLATDNAPPVLGQVASSVETVPVTLLESPRSTVPATSGVADSKQSAVEPGAQLTPAGPGVSVLPDETHHAGAETERAPAVEDDDASRKARCHGSALPR